MQADVGEAVRSKTGIEWRTMLLVMLCWLAYGLLTYFWQDLGWLIVAPAGSYILCFYGSLQHEAVHGHPTRSNLVNEALVALPIGILFPYRRYRTMHITHHNNDHLTDPARDPESSYLEPRMCAGLPAPLRLLYTLNNSLLGRLVLGPAITAVRFLAQEIRLIAGGNFTVVRIWAAHIIGLMLVWAWVSGVCGMPFWQYIMGIAYWGLSLTLLRSFAEHRAHANTGCRTIIVESNPVISLMFLNNNLHMAHHEEPGIAWYRLPSYYRANKDRLLHENCGYLIKGYRQMFRDFALTPKEPLAHPLPESLEK
ncbi:MAG: fatty acid desaturase [Rhizobiales bacterium]|nr:fatty acid desaturase [Hyphomicrobiales bacterium]